MKIKVFAHSRLDALLVAVALGQLGILLCGVWSFGRVAWEWSLFLGLVNVFLMCTNFECVAHNFIHHPFFTRRRWNTAFATFNSLLIGNPQSLYRIHHLLHHKYNNDLPDPRTGTTLDPSSTWRHGDPPKREESLLHYALFNYFRTDFRLLMREARRKGFDRNVYLEAAFLGSSLAAIAVLRPHAFLAFYLPVWLIGNCASHAQTYLEHYGATPGNRKTDSVSSYGRLYNVIWFNHGYHQEHHYRPQVHWTEVPKLRALLPPDSERRVAWGAHWFNLGPVRRPEGWCPQAGKAPDAPEAVA